jgi:hypothetical protein
MSFLLLPKKPLKEQDMDYDKDNQPQAESEKVQKILDALMARNILKYISARAKTLTPEEQEELSRIFADLPLIKDTSKARAKRSGKAGRFFTEARKEKSSAKLADKKSAPVKKTPVRRKEKEETPETDVNTLTSNVIKQQAFKYLISDLSRISNPQQRAQIAYKLISQFPRKTDDFISILRNMLRKKEE